MVSGPTVVRPLAAAAPDWSASYAYARWRPTWFAGASRQAVFRTISSGTPAALTEVAGLETEVQAGVFVPFVHLRQSAQVFGAMVASDTRYRLATADRVNRTVAARLAASYDSTERLGYSISRERGVLMGTTVELARRALGSRAEATTATLDVRGYLPGLGTHHVVALRAAGGLSQGADLARQLFSLGAVGASPGVIDFGSSALGLMRGGVPGTTSGDQILVGNVEYRLPLAILERGRGTRPLPPGRCTRPSSPTWRNCAVQAVWGLPGRTPWAANSPSRLSPATGFRSWRQSVWRGVVTLACPPAPRSTPRIGRAF